ncbi:MAG: CPBP family intramembrane glutamic endopeptidase, partial [Ruminococcus sp.]|nr:CPBP family intramembrane glutamic endopeptidase [Ruminococcus sp.]
MERTLKKAIRTASNVNSLMLLLFYGLIYAAVFGIQLLIPHLLPEDSTYYEAIYEVIVYFVQYVVIVPVLLLLFRAILGRKIGWNLKDSYRKPQASGGQLFRWCLIALGLVYATSMASQIFFNVVEMVTDVELQSPSMVAEENWVGYLNNIVAFSLYAPIFEEMLFRATLFRNTERFGSWFGVIMIGITFGLWHCNYEQFFYTAILGICAAFLTAKTRSVLPAMAIHFTMNFIGTMLSIAYSGLDTDNLDLEGMLQHP